MYTDGINTFVRVEAFVDSIICTFSNQYEGDEKSCSIVYESDCQQPLSEKLSGQVSDGVSVKVPLLQSTEHYCYIVTAMSGTTIVNVTGTFTYGHGRVWICTSSNGMHINFVYS